MIDARSDSEPSIFWTEFPISPTSYGFRKVTCRGFANAINGAPEWLEASPGGRSPSHDVLAYIGLNDIRYMIFVVTAIEADYVLLPISRRNSIAAQLNLFRLTSCRRIRSTDPEPSSLSAFAPQAQLPMLHAPTVKHFLDHQFPRFAFERAFEEAEEEPLVIFAYVWCHRSTQVADLYSSVRCNTIKFAPAPDTFGILQHV